MTRVLVTGFEPFGEHDVNPSALIADALGGVVLAGWVERVFHIPPHTSNPTAAAPAISSAIHVARYAIRSRSRSVSAR